MMSFTLSDPRLGHFSSHHQLSTTTEKVLQRNKEDKRIVSLTIVGPGAPGKSCLLNRFVNRDFHANEGFGKRPLKIGNEMFDVQIWDTSGNERYLQINEMYLRLCDGVIIVYDITDDRNFAEARTWTEHYMKRRKFGDREKIVVGNKCDLEDRREVSILRGYQFAAKYGARFFEVSALTCENVEKSLVTLVKNVVAKADGKKENKVPEDFLNDPFALNLYQEALETGKEKDKSIRINVVGNYRQGKTSLTKRLLGQSTKKIESTNGITVERYKCQKTKGGKLCYHKSCESNRHDFIRRLAQAAINCKLQSKDDETVSTLTESESNKDQKQESEKPTTKEPVPAVHYQASSDETGLNASKSGEYISRKGFALSTEEEGIFTKALTTVHSSKHDLETVFDIWDFGGQYIFYATHAIFHSRKAIYLLVFDLSLGLDHMVRDSDFPIASDSKDVKYFVQFWMSSIHSFVGSTDGMLPTVILVGTHKDRLKGKKTVREAKIKEYFNDVRQLFDGTPLINHIYREDFAIDTTDAKDVSVISLRETISKIGDEQSETIEIPIKWVQLERSLYERKHLKLISLKFVLAIDAENDNSLGDIEQIKLFLRYHHSKGTFVYFDEEPISDYVVLDPQYLIDAFKSIITSQQFCTNNAEVRPLWQMLLTEGRLEEQLIDKQWGNPDVADQMFMENKQVLLSFLVKHNIISQASVYDENTNLSTGLGWYVVPSLLKDQSSETDIQSFLAGKKHTQLRYLFMFHSTPIVPTIYHRLLSAVVGKWPVAKADKKTLLFKDLCILRMNIDHAAVVEMKIETIELTVVSLCPSNEVKAEQADLFRRFSEAVISFEFRKLRGPEETVNKPYDIWCRCNHESHGITGSENIMPWNDLIGRQLVPCPDLKTHEISVDNAKGEWFQDHNVFSHVPNVQLTDKLLGNISQCIGENWQLLGYELGLTHVQLEHVIADHRNTVMRIYAMLQKWRQTDGDEAMLKDLVQAMQRCLNLSIDWDTLRNILDDFN